MARVYPLWRRRSELHPRGRELHRRFPRRREDLGHQQHQRGRLERQPRREHVNTGLYFKGVEIVWDPVFDTLDTEDSPATAWSDRCYLLNTNHLSLRPIKGHWMVSRKPPRVYDRYVHYWALTAKAAMTTNKRRAHAVLALSGS